MQSNKWTFSLASFVMFLAIGLFVVSSATAGELGANFKVEFKVTDVSNEGGIQVEDTDNGITVMIVLAKEITDAEASTLAKWSVSAYDHNGVLLSSPTFTIRDAGTMTGVEAPGTAKMYDLNFASDTIATGSTVVISVAKGALTNANQADVISALNPENSLGKNERAQLVFKVVDKDIGAPTVLSISRVDPSTVSNFSPVGVRGPFSVQVLLSEMPKVFTAADHLEVTNAIVDSVIVGSPIVSLDIDGDMSSKEDNFGPSKDATGRGDPNGDAPDNTTDYDSRPMLQSYLVMITPDLKNNNDIVISVKDFEDMVLPISGKYARGLVANLTEGQGKLTLKVDPTAVKADDTVDGVTKAQREGKLPHEYIIPDGKVIPANGYLILARGNDGQSAVRNSPDKLVDRKEVGQDMYSVAYDQGFPYPGDDLQNEFRNGATIQLVYKNIPNNPAGANADTGYNGGTDDVVAAGDVIINEVMWGRDEGLGAGGADRLKSQWIELHNTTSSPISIDKSEWFIVFGTSTSLTGGVVVDMVGNNPASGYWPVPGNGGVSTVSATAPALMDLVSMVRVMGATDGTMEASWKASTLPSRNIIAQKNHIATPGAANNYTPDPVVVVPPPPPPPTPTSVAMKDDIDITEIMVDSGSGRFPQWIELTNQAAEEVSLDGWSLNISNDPADDGVLSSSLVIDLSGNTLGVSEHPGNMGKGQSLLVIAFSGRGSDNLGNVAIVDASDAGQLDQTGRYMFLSETAFKLVLMPPQTSGITVYGDMAGNLENGAAAWALPMSEGMRSSLIRMEMDAAGMMTMGTSADGWREASMTDLASGQITWYGSDEDAGTPGYDAGGPLPVELSMFYPKRDQLTGQVVITWETQSELNNAGFFIKRSEAKDGDFKVINPTMIAGAGTTSEKQSYTYTDTSAKPNVVYYYQIEDVSLDGQRQTLTLGTRLRGHVGAAGKLTTTWGELKNVQE